jgi:hypothetical protein
MCPGRTQIEVATPAEVSRSKKIKHIDCQTGLKAPTDPKGVSGTLANLAGFLRALPIMTENPAHFPTIAMAQNRATALARCPTPEENPRTTGTAAMTRVERVTGERVTLANMRSHGCRDLRVYCTSGWCHHSSVMNADALPDDTALLELDRRMVCSRCGLVGADVRPDWSSITGGAGIGGAHSLS